MDNLTEKEVSQQIENHDGEKKPPLREAAEKAMAGEGITPKIIGGLAAIPSAIANIKPRPPVMFSAGS